jgi:hypothetical protein
MTQMRVVRGRDGQPTRSLLRRAVSLAGMLALTISCASDTPLSPSRGNPVPAPPALGPIVLNGRLDANVDGSPWQMSAVVTIYGPASFVLSASRSSTPESPLGMSAPLTVGTHGVNVGSLRFLLYNYLVGASWQASQLVPGSSGTLTLTEATADRVAGTFSFTAVAGTPGLTPATRSVTNGSFAASR